ncbi:MAG: AzlC family ABC transporter permease [Longicatena sp.]
MELIENNFRQGLKDGIPIGLGYLSVSFTFGMMAVTSGVPVGVAVMISLLNLTSAGQFSGLALILAQGSYLELALSQLVINLRYALMSLSLTQKIDNKMKMSERALISYGITDEIFALASSTYERVGKMYMFGLIAFPLFCWTFGTFLGGAASNILPTVIRESLGIAIYGMFLAIIIPPAKKLSSVRKVLIIAIIMSCVFAIIYPYIPVSSGFVIIICTVVASALGAYFFPVEEVTHHE